MLLVVRKELLLRYKCNFMAQTILLAFSQIKSFVTTLNYDYEQENIHLTMIICPILMAVQLCRTRKLSGLKYFLKEHSYFHSLAF